MKMTAAYQNTIPLTDEQQFALTTEGRKMEAEAARQRILAKRNTTRQEIECPKQA